MNDVCVFSEFDPVRYHVWIAMALWGTFFAVCFLVAVIDQGKHVKQSMLQIALFQVLIVPYIAYLMLWSYAHPERFVADLRAKTIDMRGWWPLLILVELLMMGFFLVYRRIYKSEKMRKSLD